jgi:signal transduction histidine kinase
MNQQQWFMLIRALLLSLPFLAPSLSAQESGLPLSRYFTANQYEAHNQNWAVSQDSTGVMFFGNTSGILRFDGSEWQMFPTPKGGIIRSLSRGYSRKMYAGAYAEFGYLTGDEFGRLRWISLSDSLPKSLREFSDVWKIHVTPRGIFFTSPQNIFLFSHDDQFIASWKPTQRFRFSYWLRNRFIVQDEQTGLCEVTGDSLVLIAGSFPLADTRVYAMLPHGDSAVLIQTRSSGTWLWENDQFNKIPWEAGRYLEEQQVYGGILTSSGQYLFTTLRNGIVITEQDGRIVQIYNKDSGLPDNTVYDIFTDRTEGIWLALNRGILRTDLFAPFTYWNESMGIEGAIFTIARNASTLFIGTSTGVFRLEKNDNVKPSIFKKLDEPQGQCWSLLSHEGTLLCAMGSGIFQIANGQTRRITDAYATALSQSGVDPSTIHVGLSNGYGRLRRTPAGYQFERIELKKNEEIRYIAEDTDNSVWLAGGFDGFQRILIDGTVREYHPNLQTRSRRSRVFSTSNGLLFVSDRGLLRFNTATDNFEKDTVIAPLLPDDGKFLLRLPEDSVGHLWVGLSGSVNADLVGKIHFKKNAGYTRFLNLRRISQFGDISTIWAEGRKIWFGGYDGLLQYKSSSIVSMSETRTIQSYPDVILTVRLKNDSLLYVGQGESTQLPEINYAMNGIHFTFADPGNLSLTSHEFKFRLKGFDTDWIRSGEFKKTYTFLTEGQYTFEVTSTEPHYDTRATTFSFVIKPPWYRRWWAFVFYALFGLTLGVFVIRVRSLYLENERRRLKKLVEQQTTELRIANTELQNSQVRLEKTIDIVQAINSELDLDKLLNSIFEMVQPLLYMQSGSVLLRDTGPGQFKFHAAFGIPMTELKHIELTEEEVMRRYVEGGEPVAEDMYFIRGLIARQGTEKFKNLGAVDSLFVIRLMEDKGLAGFLFFDDVQEVTARNLLLLTGLKEHIRIALTKARLLSELKMLNEKKNEYLGIVAHDLRNPLTTIVGYTDLLIEDFRKGKINADGGIEDLSKIAGVSRHMNRFITELLDISSIESGKVRMELRSCDLKKIVGECEYLHRRSAQNKNIELIVDYGIPLPHINVDTSKISSVMDNLLSNAIKYSYPGGKVRVHFEELSNEVVTHVQDTGQGLSEEDLKKVFTSFNRLSSKPTGGEPSTGLGLAIVKKIVELHHGRVWVESIQGKGSTFSFSLPVSPQTKS